MSKRSRVDAFRDETPFGNQQIVMDLASKKLDHKMAELAVKRKKLDVVGHREREKERLVAEERKMAAQERILEKEHKRQREAEEHAERMIRLQIELARAGGSGTAPDFRLPDIGGTSSNFTSPLAGTQFTNDNGFNGTGIRNGNGFDGMGIGNGNSFDGTGIGDGPSHSWSQ
jgi:hypothetical protein